MKEIVGIRLNMIPVRLAMLAHYLNRVFIHVFDRYSLIEAINHMAASRLIVLIDDHMLGDELISTLLFKENVITIIDYLPLEMEIKDDDCTT